MKTKLSLLVLFSLLFCFTGCDDDDEVFYDGDIIGKWQLVECEVGGVEGRQSVENGMIVEYFANGKYSWQYFGDEDVYYAEFSFEENRLYKKNGNVKYTYEYEFKENTLILKLVSTDGLFCGTGVMNLGIYRKVN